MVLREYMLDYLQGVHVAFLIARLRLPEEVEARRPLRLPRVQEHRQR